jgi:hypothetical protein
MTPRSLFAIIIKVIAIYLIVASLLFIPQLLSTSIMMFQPGLTSPSAGEFTGSAFIIILIIGFYIFFLRLCLFKTEWIIDKLRLSEGFTEEKFELNIHRSTLLKIAVIVTGAIIVVDSLPLFCKELFYYIQMNKRGGYISQTPTTGWAVYYFVKKKRTRHKSRRNNRGLITSLQQKRG